MGRPSPGNRRVDHGRRRNDRADPITGGKQPRRAGDSPLKGSYEPQQVPADDRRQRIFASELTTYYAAVIARIRAAGVMVGIIVAPYLRWRRLAYAHVTGKHELVRIAEPRTVKHSCNQGQV